MKKFKLIPIEEYNNNNIKGFNSVDTINKEIDVSDKATQTDFLEVNTLQKGYNQSNKLESYFTSPSTSPSNSTPPPPPSPPPPPGIPVLIFNSNKKNTENSNIKSNGWVKYWRKSIK